jgi:glycosyltransferase involved in cell wall biosynthesis
MPPLLWIICIFKRWNYTYIVHDYYPEFAVELGYIRTGGVIYNIWEKINSRLLIQANHIVALGPVMKKRIVKSAPKKFNEDTISVIHNWADGDFIRPKKKHENWFSKKHDLVEPFSLVYSGNTGEYHDLETVIHGISQGEGINVMCLIIGDGDNKNNLISLADSLNIKEDRVKFLPYQPWAVVPHSITSGDISIVAVNEGFCGLCVSSKLYSALAAGKPVLVISASGSDEAKIIKKYDAGKHVTPGKPQEVVEAINQWYSNPNLMEKQGENARAALENHFSGEESLSKYYEMWSAE